MNATHYISLNKYFYYTDSFGKVDYFHTCSALSSPLRSPSFVPSSPRWEEGHSWKFTYTKAEILKIIQGQEKVHYEKNYITPISWE